MSTKLYVLHVDHSDDGVTNFAAIADILDNLADLFGFDPYAHGFLLTRAMEARKIEIVMQKEGI